MLTITIPREDPTRLEPFARQATAWIHRLGPTAWVLCQWGWVECQGMEPGTSLIVDVDDLRIFLGVKTSVVHNALARLSRFGIIHYDVGHRQVVGDFTLPQVSTPHAIPVHVLPLGDAA